MTLDDYLKTNTVSTPVYICEEQLLENNLKLLDRVQKESGAKVILALKGFAMWSTFPLVREYLQGCTASGLHEALTLTEAPQRALAAARIGTLLEERERLRARLSALPLIERVYPSDANFLLVRCSDASAVLARAASVGLLLRDFSRVPRLEACVRITIGTPEQNARLLNALEQP
jgi:hypothetical protein